jgi:CubicO group peptidase (beta-lactamase class C family)
MAISTSARLTSLITSTTANPTAQAPGLVFRAITRDGSVLNTTAAGVRSLDSPQLMTDDTVFWIASCTKMVGAIALMQLVEQGKADLDSADQLEKYVPEMKSVQVLEGGKLKEKKNGITLRMLMAHVSRLVSLSAGVTVAETSVNRLPD